MSAPGPGAGALVTGAGRGLGLEIARVLVRRGLLVHVTDVDGALAEAAAAELGAGAMAAALDVRDETACRGAARAVVERAGSLALWVNNAGVVWTGVPWEQDGDRRRAMLEVNAVGTINGTLAALEPMRAAGSGHVINVVSLAGLVAAPGETVYSASKHAAIAFSLGTLLDLRRAGFAQIEISCVCPDGIWTPMLHDKLDDPDAAASFSGTMLRPEQVAKRVDRLVDRPRPVVSVPRYRGALIRAFDLWPRAAMPLVRPLLGWGRLQQRLLKRRIAAGRWP